VTARADRWIRRTTIGCVGMLALIAGTVSYLHMHLLVELHGQPGWVAALTPLSVDGMILAASTTLLADSRNARSGGVLPWLLLAAGSAASLAANVAVAEPTMTGRVIAAWPSFALIGSYELLMRQIRASAAGTTRDRSAAQTPRAALAAGPAIREPAADVTRRAVQRAVGPSLRQQALDWAVANRSEDGRLPSGKVIADHFGRHERWGRLVKQQIGEFQADVSVLRSAA
jgi:hypothetical protein